MRALSASIFLVCSLLVVSPAHSEEQDLRNNIQYNTDGAVVLPEDFRHWIHLGSSIGLTYADVGFFHSSPGLFKNVYMHPAAFAHYDRTGEFAEGTMFIATIYSPASEESIAKGGYFQKEHLATEIALKDSARFSRSWAYYSLGKNQRSAQAMPQSSSCNDCHSKHAQQDNVFVQFYPVLQAMAEGD
jgi:hypothetical protein